MLSILELIVACMCRYCIVYGHLWTFKLLAQWLPCGGRWLKPRHIEKVSPKSAVAGGRQRTKQSRQVHCRAALRTCTMNVVQRGRDKAYNIGAKPTTMALQDTADRNCAQRVEGTWNDHERADLSAHWCSSGALLDIYEATAKVGDEFVRVRLYSKTRSHTWASILSSPDIPP